MFVSDEDARRAPSTDAELGGGFLDILGNVATQYINTKVPGLGPVLNPGMYKDQAAEQQKQQAAAAAAAQQQQMLALQAQKKEGLPSWVLPASIAGGVGILAIILALTLGGRRKNPAKFTSARDLTDAYGTKGYYTDSRGYVGVRAQGWVNWFRWDSGKGGYRKMGSTRSAEGAEYRKVA